MFNLSSSKSRKDSYHSSLWGVSHHSIKPTASCVYNWEYSFRTLWDQVDTWLPFMSQDIFGYIFSQEYPFPPLERAKTSILKGG